MLANYLESHPGIPGMIYGGPYFRRTAEGAALLSAHGACECCRVSADGEPMVVDHDHGTNLVRGVLCNGCNSALGSYHDNIEMIRRYAEVLRTPGMPNPSAIELDKWNEREYIFSDHPGSATIEIQLPAFKFEFTNHGKTLTMTVGGKSDVKHRSLPMTPQEQQLMVAELKTKGIVYWDGQEI